MEEIANKKSGLMTGFSIASIVASVFSIFENLAVVGLSGLGAGLSDLTGDRSMQTAFGGVATAGMLWIIGAIAAITAAIMLLMKKRTGYKVAIGADVCVVLGVLAGFSVGAPPVDLILFGAIYGAMTFFSRRYFYEEAPKAPVISAPNAASAVVYRETPQAHEPAREKEKEKETCKSCGAELKAGAKFCAKCGASVAEHRETPPTHEHKETHPATEPAHHHDQGDHEGGHEHRVHYHCPKCHHGVEADTTVCPGCGVHLKPHSSQQAHHKTIRYRCPKCHHELEAGATQCPGCGVRLKPRAQQDRG